MAFGVVVWGCGGSHGSAWRRVGAAEPFAGDGAVVRSGGKELRHWSVRSSAITAMPAKSPDLDAPIIATQNQQLTNLDQFGLVGWNGGFAPQDNWAFNTDPIPPPPPQPSSADISAIATLFQNWVNSIPAKANFTAASLAASWVGFLVSAGIHQNVPVPFIKLDPASGMTSAFSSQSVTGTIQLARI